MTRRIISTFRLAEPAIAMWSRKRAPRLKSSAPYCRLVVGTPDVHRASSVGGRLEDCKERQQSRIFLDYVNQFFIMLMTSPKSGKGAEQEHRDSTLSISEHKRRQKHPRQLSTFNFKYNIGERLRLSGTRKAITIIERYH